MKILILGAKGMLGQALKEEFEKSYEVLAWDREEIDITDKNQVTEKISALAPEVIINAAAYNAVDQIEENEADFELAKKVNSEAVGYLAEAAAEVGAIFVHYSTDYVFKGDKVEGYKEDDEPEPVSRYAETKWEGEKKISNFQFPISKQIPNPKSQIPNLKFYLIRTSRLFGPAGTGEGAKKSFVDTMLDLYNQGKREFDLVDEELSLPTYSRDLAKLTRYIIEQKLPFGIYHGANSGTCTWYEFGKEIFRLKNLQVKINPVSASKFPRPAKRPMYSELINTKLPKQRSWQEALAEYLEGLRIKQDKN